MEFVEKRLVHQARIGDVDAFTQLIELYKDKIYQLGYRMLGNPHDAEEIAQETFLRVYTNLHHYDQNQKFSTWIYRIATNLSIDRIRKRKTNISIDQENGEEGQNWHSRLADQTVGPLEKLVERELKDTVQEAILSLPAKYRTIIILRYIQDLTLKEISEVLQMPVSTIKTRIHRGREALREKLKS